MWVQLPEDAYSALRQPGQGTSLGFLEIAMISNPLGLGHVVEKRPKFHNSKWFLSFFFWLKTSNFASVVIRSENAVGAQTLMVGMHVLRSDIPVNRQDFWTNKYLEIGKVRTKYTGRGSTVQYPSPEQLSITVFIAPRLHGPY
jgi:hypothetical protein